MYSPGIETALKRPNYRHVAAYCDEEGRRVAEIRVGDELVSRAVQPTLELALEKVGEAFLKSDMRPEDRGRYVSHKVSFPAANTVDEWILRVRGNRFEARRVDLGTRRGVEVELKRLQMPPFFTTVPEPTFEEAYDAANSVRLSADLLHLADAMYAHRSHALEQAQREVPVEE